jgi:hypothetical protein
VIEERDPTADVPCTCLHPQRWHLKHAQVARERVRSIRWGRCLVKVKNGNGFPVACHCRTFIPTKKKVKA